MDHLDEIVRDAVFWYASNGIHLKTFPMISARDQTYAVLVTDEPKRKQPAAIVVFARIVGDYVLIEEDSTDRPLSEALIDRGIPNDRIIRVYAGESLPDEVQGLAV